MSKYKSLALPFLFVLFISPLMLTNVLSNPRLAAAHGSDILKLVAVGFSVGTVFGIVIAGRVCSSKREN